MENREVTKSSAETTLDFIQTSADISKLAQQNGFGNGKYKTGAAQDLAKTLKSSGDISSDTAKTILRSVKKRNEICHNKTSEPVTEKENNAFSAATTECQKIIEKYKTDGILTML